MCEDLAGSMKTPNTKPIVEQAPEFVAAPAIARRLSVTPRYILQLVEQGRIPCVRLGSKCVRFKPPPALPTNPPSDLKWKASSPPTSIPPVLKAFSVWESYSVRPAESTTARIHETNHPAFLPRSHRAHRRFQPSCRDSQRIDPRRPLRLFRGADHSQPITGHEHHHRPNGKQREHRSHDLHPRRGLPHRNHWSRADTAT